MKKFFKKLDWIFDYYVAYFLYNPNKLSMYNDYMSEKWCEKFTKIKRNE